MLCHSTLQFYFYGTEDRIQSFVHARQTLYPSAITRASVSKNELKRKKKLGWTVNVFLKLVCCSD